MTRDLVDIMGGSRGRAPERIGADDSEQVAERVDLCDLDMVLHYETADAIRVSDTGEDSRAIWLPKRHVEFHREGKQSDAVRNDGQRTVLPVVNVTMPEWLAKDRGLV